MTKTERDLFEGILSLPSFPVVLVTVERNIMTAAAFHFYSFEPPCVMVGVIPENLTHELILKNDEFGINILTADQIHIADICGSVSGRSEDKFKKAGLTPIKGKLIESFLIEECPVNLECLVVHEIDYEGTHRWFIGEIKVVHIDSTYTRDKALMYWLNEYRRVGKILKKSKRK
jgi:flavin reductase (DIM6/NTAB) family NADH-FMN oxidoreductase RutF